MVNFEKTDKNKPFAKTKGLDENMWTHSAIKLLYIR